MNPEERKRALEVECDRTKARLDKLDAYLAGDQDAWIAITVRLPDTVAEVTVDKAIAEARQLALAFATMTKTLATLGDEAGTSQASAEDEIKKRREERARKRATG